ncbi:bifunctional precorrin-2 dehydrogenase/sirohydrochlorin ferrochelatase, partial [Thermodesulfobacteriota bacterium]
MSYYPIFVDLEGEKVIVVGGGGVAQRKIETLLTHGAVVHVISRELTPVLNRYKEEGQIKFLNREFKGKDLQGAFLVIA